MQLVAWITSDGQGRTNQEILDEMYVSLGYVRREHRITKALPAAIRRAQLLRERYGPL